MSVEWDERKRRANLVKHGVDFTRAIRIFDGPTLEAQDRRDYGETRIGAFGEADGDVFFVVYTWRGPTGASSAPERQDRMKRTSIVRRSRHRARGTDDRTNMSRLRRLGDAALARAATSDPDTFMPDVAWFRRARLVTPQTKKMVTLRLDPDVLEWFQRGGKRYQTRINAVLRAFVEAQPGRR